jgi:hypothetical protein
MGSYAEAITDCDTAVELSEGLHWQPYHTRGLVAKIQAQFERREVRAFSTLSCGIDCRDHSYSNAVGAREMQIRARPKPMAELIVH